MHAPVIHSSSMRPRFARAVVTILLATCLVCPLIEMFDHWDHTVQTGNDSEYTLVVLALCVGAAYSFARFIVTCPVARCLARPLCSASAQIFFLSSELGSSSLFNAITSPPLELRI